ncbi:uncharacterized protein VP01_4836g3 [Puccinia sorghi]|uniref:Uncharacterized protein n=1 Tax=Puccinia sorghi TaxID=27349 RepID=A0A0L6UPD4_9BASI|nr:uncharacterized protein VP01_4836g3 [Puccinia sorghi]
MALDADLKMWERWHAEDGKIITMTLAATSPPNKHSRKSSRFSLFPRLLISSISPQAPNTTMLEKNTHSALLSNNNHPLLPLDVGGGLASSLGIIEELSRRNNDHSSSMPKDQAGDFAENTAPLQRSFGESRAADGR